MSCVILPTASPVRPVCSVCPVRPVRPVCPVHWLLCIVMLMVCTACASSKATLKAPELPPRHWLEEAPGVPVVNKEKLAAAIPNLYDADKVFAFDDCVFLTIQQSPMLVNSAVDLEIKKLNLTDALWQYLPEPRMTLSASSNLTRYNDGMRDTPSNYGQPAFRVGVNAHFPNPVATYFNHQAQKVMVGLAISAHRKAIGKAINQIAEIYLKIEAQRCITEEYKTLIPLSKTVSNYWRQVETADGRQGVSLNIARQREREAELKLERSTVQEIMLRTKLKILAGVNPEQQLKLDTSDADNILNSFDGVQQSWEARWAVTEDELLLRAQVKLHDFNIMVAWARYLPNATMQVNASPPAGQYQPARGREDVFFHLFFDFPLIDWGRRYRGVQTARMTKAKAFQELGHQRTQYANNWLEARQRMSLAETTYKLAQNALQVAQMEFKEAEINFKGGLAPFPDFAAKREAFVTARISAIEADLDFKLARLQWMHLASVLQERYLGPPQKELL